jgi:hypothetical protein
MMHIVLFLLSCMVVLLYVLVLLYVIMSGLPHVSRALCFVLKRKKKYPFSVFKNRGVTEGLLKSRRGLMG